jgi:ferric-dicitrate binding protein FerR (iron transport regulator)
LGTRFDVRDYHDDVQASATLLAGKILVESGTMQVVLAPSERAAWGQDQGIDVQQDDMADASIAWTRGFFGFRNATLQEAMRQLSRWFDLDVEYEGTPPAVPITASINRNTSAWEVLDALKEMTGLKYKVEGRKVIVLH